MKRAKRWMIALVTALFALSGVAATAMAAQLLIPVACSESGPLTVRVPEQGNWAAAQIVDETGHFIPYRFSGDVYVDDVLVESFVEEKGGNAQQNQGQKETCTFEESFEEGGQTFTFVGTVDVIRRP